MEWAYYVSLLRNELPDYLQHEPYVAEMLEADRACVFQRLDNRAKGSGWDWTEDSLRTDEN